MSSASDGRADGGSVSARPSVHCWAVFSVTWAGAVLFHLAGNPRLAPPWGRGLLGAAALLVLVRPRDPRAIVPLCAAVLVNVWLEAPLLANHWLLHGFIALVVLGAVAVTATDADRAVHRLVGPARLLLLAFYVFAAFAKLNTDFFDPAVSCAVFFLRESATSWGALSVVDWLPAWGERGVAVVAAAIELSVPVLLIRRRTREFGVVFALAFHFLVAVDRNHQFFDFSSVLLVLFLLFLSPSTTAAAVDQVRAVMAWIRARWPSGPELLRIAGLAAVSLVVVTAAGPGEWPAPPVLLDVGVVVWLIYGGAVLIVVERARRATRVDPDDLPRLAPAGAPRWLYVVPAVALLNGATPYLELKSANGWNMYSNLAVVDGESNHLLVQEGLPLTDAHERLVQVIRTEDPSLRFYVDGGWLLPERQLLDYLADREGVVVQGRVHGELVIYVGGEVDDRPAWRQKLQLFRAVDGEAPVSCQPSFGPAR